MITIQKAALKAASRFAAKRDVRYYMIGVYVQATATETRLIATDGHTMLIHRSKTENTHAWDGIIPLDTVTAILKHKSPYEKRDTYLPVELSECGGTEARIDHAGHAFIFKPVDGKFPDYARVIPKTVSGEAACYQPTTYSASTMRPLILATQNKPVLPWDTMAPARHCAISMMTAALSSCHYAKI